MSIEARFDLALPGFRLHVDLQLPGRGVSALFGPSGSGKTTLLRCIAGLERTPAARLRVNGETWQDGRHFLPAHRRPLGYVFQDARLFPHLSVRANLEYGRRRVRDAMDAGALERAVELLGIGHLLGRMPDRLSGGERQRVAIARALALSPRLLLMDEPLAALDVQRKREILPYLERLHDESAIPVLYVSHLPEEVIRLADYLLIVDAGQAVASGPLSEVINRTGLALRGIDEAETVLEAKVIGHDTDDDLTRLRLGGHDLLLPRRPLPPDRTLRVRIRARDVSLALSRPTDSSILNILPVTVLDWREDAPGQALVRLDLDGRPLLASLTRRSVRALGLAPGKRVFAQVKTAALTD